MGLGQLEGGSGGSSLPQTPGREPGGKRSPLNLQRLTCKQPRGRAPDRHRLPAADPASWPPLATGGRFPLLGSPNQSRAPGSRCTACQSAGPGGGRRLRLEGEVAAACGSRGSRRGRRGGANVPGARPRPKSALCRVTRSPAVCFY